MRIFIRNTKKLAMLQNLTCIAFDGVSANLIFVCIFQEGRINCFILAGRKIFHMDVLSYINTVANSQGTLLFSDII